MRTLVNYAGDEDFCSGGSLYANPMDSSLLLSLGPHVDVYCPPRKRSRITAPFVFRGDKFEQKKQSSIEVLPDECLFEIFRRLPGGQERSICACVSKRWLFLLSSIRRTEVYGIETTQPAKHEGELVSDKTDEFSKLVKEEPASVSSDVASVGEDLEVESEGYFTRSLGGKKATDIRLAAIAVGTGSRGGLGKLLIRGSNSIRGVTDNGLTAIARGCPSLRVLSLWNVSSVGDKGLSDIASGCHMLEKLDLCQCSSISDKGLMAIAENCPNLAALTIECCSKIGNGTLQAIGQYCPNLQSISIKDCPLIGDQGIANLLSSASHVLTKVKLQALNITDVSLAVVGHYGKAVTELVLTGLQNVSERGFWVMGNTHGLLKLKSITISSCRGVTDLGLQAVGKGCPDLKQLILRKCSFVSDNGLVDFARAAASLENLQLEECNRITQSGVLGAISNCGSKLKALAFVKCMGIKDMVLELPMLSPCDSLRSLSIRNCPGFGSSSLAVVGKLCPRLQNIELSGLCGITDAGLLPLVENCEPGLVKVNLSGCLNLTDAVVTTMAKHHGGTLQLLNLDGCRKITDASLIAIANNCSVLRDLDISKCVITDLGVAAMSSANLLDLQILSLSGCYQVSDKSMPFLKSLGQNLVGLNLQQCNSISSSTIELLMEHLWRCDILS
ncbi:PREDICTED: EIN3-binding F-box protein 1-like [Nelumbo nucifera]|uniref:EIN3-binding F-box protein 1-like n=1 Tax=Nelumbo nucifera TaxID=4432 RepID=A0A1U7ZNE8_NELNU|nr:PREDICTED: EIN3-binding F-box protein 1-like [Nelumbo nucifera]